jgi:hypothetical protein
MEKRFCQSSENNKLPILNHLKSIFESTTQVLEIGSGTGQHAVYFSANLPHLKWRTSDVSQNHPTIEQWIKDFPSSNVMSPVKFVLGEDKWPVSGIDGVFTANTTHIMQPDEARLMMEEVAENILPKGVFCQYGPFNVDGKYTSEGNQKFDQHLKNEGCGGIRDIQELQTWVAGTSLRLVDNISMPANNFLLVWHKKA